MSKKQRVKAAAAVEQPKPRGFVPRPCSQCSAIRPAGTNYSRVYHTRANIRYCKCGFCNNTWSQYFVECTTPMVQQANGVPTVVVSCTHGISGDSSSSD